MLSLAKECACILTLERENGADNFIKNNRREFNQAMKERLNHNREESKIKTHTKTVGLSEGLYNGLRCRYRLYFNPQLGAGRAAVRKISCGC